MGTLGNGALVDTARGPLMDPVRGREWVQYGDAYGPSEGALVDLLVIRGHLWITGFGYCAGVLINQVRACEWVHYGGTYGSSERSLVDLIVVRGRLWIAGAYRYCAGTHPICSIRKSRRRRI